MSAKQKPDVAVLLDRIGNIVRPSGEGALSVSNMFMFDEIVRLLSGALDWPANIPPVERYGITRDAVHRTVQQEAVSGGPFETEHRKAISRYLQRSPQTYTLLSTWRGLPSSARMRKSIGTAVITVQKQCPKAFAKARMTLVQRAMDFGHIRMVPDDGCFVRATVTARGWHEAYHESVKLVDLLRGELCFLANSREVALQVHPTGPLNRLRQGPIDTLHQGSGARCEGNYWYHPIYTQGAAMTIGPAEWSRILSRHSALRRKLARSNYREWVEEVLIAYVRAFDLVDWSTSFIRGWTLLEHLTDCDHKSDVLIKRCSFVWSDPPYHRALLSCLRVHRNSSVHTVRSQDTNAGFLVYQVKRYVNSLIRFHIAASQKLASPNQTARVLNSPTDAKELKKARQILDIANTVKRK